METGSTGKEVFRRTFTSLNVALRSSVCQRLALFNFTNHLTLQGAISCSPCQRQRCIVDQLRVSEQEKSHV